MFAAQDVPETGWRCGVCGFVRRPPVSAQPVASQPGLSDWVNGLLEQARRDGEGGELLQIGCGAGEGLEQARALGVEVMGVEADEAARQAARHRLPGVFIAGTIEALPSHNFDFVLISGELPNQPDLHGFFHILFKKMAITSETRVILELPATHEGLNLLSEDALKALFRLLGFTSCVMCEAQEPKAGAYLRCLAKGSHFTAFMHERYVPGTWSELTSYEHLPRYDYACRLVTGMDVLDFGCGTGYGARRLADAAREVLAVDISEAALDYARSFHMKENLRFERNADLAASLGEGRFDLITCFEVIEHIEASQQRELIGRFERLLKPGGILLISTPNPAVTALYGENPYHLHEMTLEEFRTLLSGMFAHVRMFSQTIAASVYLLAEDLPARGEVSYNPELFQGGDNVAVYVAACARMPLPVLPSTVYPDMQRDFVSGHMEMLHLRNKETADRVALVRQEAELRTLRAMAQGGEVEQMQAAAQLREAQAERVKLAAALQAATLEQAEWARQAREALAGQAQAVVQLREALAERAQLAAASQAATLEQAESTRQSQENMAVQLREALAEGAQLAAASQAATLEQAESVRQSQENMAVQLREALAEGAKLAAASQAATLEQAESAKQAQEILAAQLREALAERAKLAEASQAAMLEQAESARQVREALAGQAQAVTQMRELWVERETLAAKLQEADAGQTHLAERLKVMEAELAANLVLLHQSQADQAGQAVENATREQRLAAMQAELGESRGRLHGAQAQAEHARLRLEQIERSTSWRALRRTQPLLEKMRPVLRPPLRLAYRAYRRLHSRPMGPVPTAADAGPINPVWRPWNLSLELRLEPVWDEAKGAYWLDCEKRPPSQLSGAKDQSCSMVPFCQADQAEKHILHILPTMSDHAAARLAGALVAQLPRPYAHAILTSTTWPGGTHEGVEVRHVSTPDPAAMLQVLDMLKPDMVHLHYWGGADEAWYRAVLDALRERKPASMQSVYQQAAPLLDEVFGTYIFASEHMRAQFGAEPSAGGAMVKVIHPGVDLTGFDARGFAPDAQNAIGMVGRLEPDSLNEDSLALLIEIVRRRPRTRAYVVGGGSLLQAYLERLEQAGVRENFRFTGHLPEAALPRWYEQFRLFVPPVWHGDASRDLALAMSQGCAVAGHEGGELPEFLGGHETLGRTLDGVADIIVDLLDNPARLDRMGQANHARAPELFSLAKMVACYTEAYDHTLLVG
ncbi:methyltransferase domain-containing protein [Acidocella sp.]|uniref:methyltransferase domain-containing protein n=1 Tax=Acidocella sp. TaxID=50710 RepID=UPI003CFE0B44